MTTRTNTKATLLQLANLLKLRNEIDSQIAAVIDRPASIGHLGEYIASSIFNIDLATTAVNKGNDGVFRTGPLAGKTVNIKFYGKLENLLNINWAAPSDTFLVLAGPRVASVTSRGGTRPLMIESVHLFRSNDLIPLLVERDVKIGVATSVPKELWKGAEIFPSQTNTAMVLSKEQRELLALFSGKAVVNA
jgi:hypothetical protein